MKKLCAVCEKEFYVKPVRYERAKTCSKDCDRIYRKGRHYSAKTEFTKDYFQEKYSIGDIRTRKTKQGKLRNFIKIAHPNTWVELAKHKWTQKYGPLIRGDITHHMDGDSLNDTYGNIIAMPRKDHPCFHSRWGLKPLLQEDIDYYISRYTGDRYEQKKGIV